MSEIVLLMHVYWFCDSLWRVSPCPSHRGGSMAANPVMAYMFVLVLGATNILSVVHTIISEVGLPCSHSAAPSVCFVVQ